MSMDDGTELGVIAVDQWIPMDQTLYPEPFYDPRVSWYVEGSDMSTDDTILSYNLVLS